MIPSKFYLYLIVLCVISACSDKKKQKKTTTEQKEPINIVFKAEKEPVKKPTNRHIDSLRYYFNELQKHRSGYNHQQNVENYYPEYYRKIKDLKASSDIQPYFKYLERLVSIYRSKSKDEEEIEDTEEVYKLNKLVLKKIFTKSQLKEIRELSIAKIVIDSTKPLKPYLHKVRTLYRKITHYIKECDFLYVLLSGAQRELCRKRYELDAKIRDEDKTIIDSILQVVSKKEVSYKENQELVMNIINEKGRDTLLPSYLKDIASVFKPIEHQFGIYGISNRYSYGDEKILQQSSIPDSIEKGHERYIDWSFYKDISILPIADSIDIYAYGTKGRKLINIKNINYLTTECRGEYYFYPFAKEGDSEEMFLFTSIHALELEYKSFPKIDALLEDKYHSVCIDSQSGIGDQKAYAKLKGYDHLYLTITVSPKGKIDDTGTYIRTIQYVDNNLVFPLWFGEYDASGCACD